jgi:branched-chain amino acid transport system permease protein
MGYKQIVIIFVTVVLMAGFTYLITRTSLGRAQRACEQDMKMASLLGINVDRTISLTFVIGASLAAVAGFMVTLYYGVVDFFIGFLAGVKAFTAAVLGGIGSLPGRHAGRPPDRPDRGLLVGLLLGRVQGRRDLLDPRPGADLPADRAARPARSGEGLTP